MKKLNPLGQTVHRSDTPLLLQIRQGGFWDVTILCHAVAEVSTPTTAHGACQPALECPQRSWCGQYNVASEPPEGAIPFSTQSLHMESTQVYPPLRACCKCPIRPNESSAQASKERQTIANAQYFSSVIPLPRGRCNYCVGFNIVKPVCSSCTQHPGGPLCWDLWDMVVTTCMTKAWTRKVKWGLLYKYCYNKLICKFS